MTQRRAVALLVAVGAWCSGCFPEFTDWKSGASSSSTSTSSTGGAASSSAASTGGAGGAPPTCEELGGACLQAPSGAFQGPGRLSNTGCGQDLRLLGVGNAVADIQTGVCQFEATPNACTAPNLLLSKGANCNQVLVVWITKQAPDMLACEAMPQGYASFKVIGGSKAACQGVGDPPPLAFDGQLDLCPNPDAGAEPCSTGGTCALPGTELCVWNETTPSDPCPSDYPVRKEQKTADALCKSSESVACAPDLVFAPDCTLTDPIAVESLSDTTCRDVPPNAASWALAAGTVEPCSNPPPTADEQFVTAVSIRPVTLCCTP